MGDRAYKLLKPIRTSFLDFSTSPLRVEAADQEVELNRRMAPDVYVGTADVIEHGELVDRMIVMQRLPDDRRLTTLLGRPEAFDDVREVAKAIAVFHEAQDPIHDAEPIAGPAALHKNWADNFLGMQPLVVDILSVSEVERARALVARFLTSRQPLFATRMADGLVRDGHGDLTAQDTFILDDGPRIIDCLAFDPALRIGDVLLDVAFMAMDLERLGGPELAAHFMEAYGDFSNERHPAALLHHYVAYRASVRVKVEAIRHLQGDPDAAAAARSYFDLCRAHLEKGQLSLTLVGGTPGTGKSTLASGISNATGAMVLTTDELRKDLTGRDHLDHAESDVDQGIYSPTTSTRTYQELLDRAGALLDRAESVVLDASWNSAADREAARVLAGDSGADLIEIECVLDADIAKERIAKRLVAGTDPSDARPEIVDELRAKHEPWPSAHKIDTRGAPADVLTGALGVVESMGSEAPATGS